MQFNFNDGGRKDAGRKGYTGDCVCRAVAIAANLPYEEVYDRLAKGNLEQRKSKKAKTTKKSASSGIHVNRKWFKDYMKEIGFEWIPTMAIGTGCKVHLDDGELPNGRLVVSLSKHYTAVIDGVINDIYNPQRSEAQRTWIHGDGTVQIVGQRCVYGYWMKNNYFHDQPHKTQIELVKKITESMEKCGELNDGDGDAEQFLKELKEIWSESGLDTPNKFKELDIYSEKLDDYFGLQAESLLDELIDSSINYSITK